ncbi:BTAD domain-containing putative transcriptional regulator [Planotetraspora kaengkrachanensis]|uniref:SARP family transcriptional regulator n=1 Tax=Planotetraspora kaengkrachanensis TaxID=575193 RepID=A0A8J3VC27_9ACTN|nr:BTAD domain-containing putative transcriptional regulator [Planotetraspora kaengkrachanensis]GIG84104.1 SARP family transcriptional regulator [Planotetraspora kaengkrachanensis]
MRFGILGATEIWPGAGRPPITVGGPRVRAFLALLLLSPGRLVTTEHLIDGVYGDDPPNGAGNAVQSQIARLRRMIGDDGLIRSRSGGYLIEADPGDIDAHRFESLAAEGRRALAEGDHRRAAGMLDEALALWRGPALADIGSAPFAAAQVTRLEESRLAATEDRMEAGLALGEHRDLVPRLEQLVAAHPVRERLRAQLMRALAASGRQADALESYADIRRTLADELGADPSPELSEAHLTVLRGEPAPRTGGRVGLPAHLTDLVGRADDVERVARLLEGHRLVTLSGPGGMGKTRLAAEAATREPGDVCFVELAAHSTVLPAILDALDLRESGLRAQEPTPDPFQRLVAALTGRPVLLVLDNCEHLVDDAAAVAQRLLGRCPALRILTTSREVLAVTGEVVFPVRPLSRVAATRLFVERATAVRPSFVEDGPALERICDLLDRLPLAIELAAARLRTLPLAEIEARLDDRFALLSRGSRTAQARHRTLRDVVEWSWNLLEDVEQVTARRLAVFAGGATREAAERVCGANAAEALSSLVDKSLVAFDGERYSMLATIRAYCSDGSAEAGQAHLDYFLHLAETAEPWSRRAEQVDWLARLSSDLTNLNAALRWAMDSGDLATAVRMVAALSPYWMLSGRRGEAGRAAAELLDLISARSDHDVVEGLEEEYVLCVLDAAAVGSAPDAHVTRARTVMAGRTASRPFLTFLWGSFSGIADGPADLRGAKDPWTLSLLHFGIGLRSWWVDSDRAEAEREFTLALRGFRALGERWGMATTLAELALLAEQRGDTAASAAMTDEALDLAGQLGATEDMANLLCRRGDAVLAGDRLAEASEHYERAAVLGRRAGSPGSLAMAQHGLARVARARGDAAQARRLCHEALASCPDGWVTVEETRARIHVTLGEIARSEGNLGEARSWLRRALGSQNLEITSAAAAVLETIADPPGRAVQARDSRPSTM